MSSKEENVRNCEEKALLEAQNFSREHCMKSKTDSEFTRSSWRFSSRVERRKRQRRTNIQFLHHIHHSQPYLHLFPSAYTSLAPSTSAALLVSRNDVASSFKTWFASRQAPPDPLLHCIFQILTSPASDEGLSAALFALSLPLSERAALRDILPCLKFFDWAGGLPARVPRHAHLIIEQ
ncbi:hypothetical protein Fmac_010443 [Flemingia macrophylla]|uniref:Uncharacterized protein n=1 Tax=Flemingia macrophylla TaxID=520843 RepID=A0ABD1MJM0_9FABA